MLRGLVVLLPALFAAPPMAVNADWELLNDGTDIGGFEQRQLTPFAILTANEDGNLLQTPTGIRISTDHGTLYELLRTSPEPDGIQPLFVSFPRPGPVTVSAWVGDGSQAQHIQGTVLPRDDRPAIPQVATTGLGPNGVAQGAIAFQPALLDDAGHRLWHYDVLFEILHEGQTVLRAQTHHHILQQELRFLPTLAGAYEAHLVFYNGVAVRNTTFTPVALRIPFVALTPLSNPAPAPVEPAESSKIHLVARTSHPDGVPLGDLVSVNAVAYRDHKRIHHTDVEASLVDPQGNEVLQSRTLHQIDAQADFQYRPDQVGTYELRLRVLKGTQAASTTLLFDVHPGARGPATLALAGPDKVNAGEPAHFFVEAQPNTVSPHVPVELLVQEYGSDTPWIRHEFHLHDRAAEPTIMFTDTGRYTVQVRSLSGLDVQTPQRIMVDVEGSLADPQPPQDAANVVPPPATAADVHWILAVAAVLGSCSLARRR
jgi:hypothetical protein